MFDPRQGHHFPDAAISPSIRLLANAMKSPAPVWLFDLDNTLHNASHAIFPALKANMNAYIAQVLGDGLVPADIDLVNATRIKYWQLYGATLLGMIKHHGVRADHFLHQTHQLDVCISHHYNH